MKKLTLILFILAMSTSSFAQQQKFSSYAFAPYASYLDCMIDNDCNPYKSHKSDVTEYDEMLRSYYNSTLDSDGNMEASSFIDQLERYLRLSLRNGMTAKTNIEEPAATKTYANNTYLTLKNTHQSIAFVLCQNISNLLKDPESNDFKGLFANDDFDHEDNRAYMVTTLFEADTYYNCDENKTYFDQE